jgi:hypothetical protein
MLLKDIALFEGPDYDTTRSYYGDGLGYSYSNWEKSALSMCKCDYGFIGPDCSLGI